MRLSTMFLSLIFVPLTSIAAENFEDTVERVINEARARGFTADFVLDHSANAATAGLELAPTTVIFFTNTRLDSRLQTRSRTSAIDLPTKVLIFENAEGDIQVRYNDTGYLADRHDILFVDPVLRILERHNDSFAQLDNGLVTVQSERSVGETTRAVIDAIEAVGVFRIPRVYDFGNNRRGDSNVVVFGNPAVGTPLMQSSQEIGLDLPQKILVWEDANGKTQITYNDPFFLAKRHALQGLVNGDEFDEEALEALLTRISGALANFAAAGAAD